MNLLVCLFLVARPLPVPVLAIEPFFFDWLHEFLCGNPSCECLGPYGVRVDD